MSGSETLLELENVTRSFGGHPVLKGISLSIRRGTIVGLVGENGAGKSTLVKCVCGILRPDSGRIVANAKISVIPQEFNLIGTLTVSENIFLGREKRKFGFLDRAAMRAESARALESLHAEIDPDSSVSELSVAKKQMVEIAKAVSENSPLLFMDEPTTVLNSRETEILFKLMRELKSRGCSILFISHRLEEIFTVCDETLVLRDGRLVAAKPSSELLPVEMAKLMVGRELGKWFPAKAASISSEPALEVEHVSSGREVKDVSFVLTKGSVTGMAGLAGAGRTELAETLFGLRKMDSGTVKIFGKPLRISSPKAAVDSGLVYLTEDRQGAGILQDFPLVRNITLSSIRKYVRGGFVSGKREDRAAEEYVSRFAIRAPSIDAPLRFLSGGNQQKAALAKCLDCSPRIFIFDEPTRGVDVGARRDIYEFIDSLARSGMACLLISSDLDEVAGICPRVLVMRSGTLAGELRDSDITQEKIMFLATGISRQ